MWTIAEYRPTCLFSLRPYTATTSGGKSLIVPTPFAVKMALLDVAIRVQGLERGKALFPLIRDLQIAVRLPQWIVVNNSFTKILRLKEIKTKASEKQAAIAQARAERQWPFQKTIAFREYVQFGGPLALGFQGMSLESLMPLLLQINYLGKRGGFIQLLPPLTTASNLPDGFSTLTAGISEAFPMGTLQMVDDCGPSLTFERANVYSDEKIRIGQDRIFHHVVMPCRPVRSSRGFTLYEQI
ncbi:MAG: hypothetical protein ACLFVT_03105 [Syntrophobacteria bacterium]